MRFRVNSAAERGLRVLPEVPSLTPCLVEGKNGIGKTVLVRLLQLISGEQPFLDRSQQWHSLRERLGETRVTVDDMAHGTVLEFEFTPTRWPSADEVPIDIGEWLGYATINGAAASVVEAEKLLWVARIAGNEDLDTTLRRRIDLYRDFAERTRRQLDRALAQVENLLEPVANELRSVDVDEYIEQRSQLGDLENRERSARERLTAALGRQEELLRAIEARERLRQAKGSATELQERRDSITNAIAATEAERLAAEQEVDEGSNALRRQGDVLSALADARHRQRYRVNRQRKLHDTAIRMAKAADVPPDLEDVASQRERTQATIDQLVSQRKKLDVSGITSRLVDRLAGLVDDGTAQGLDDEELLSLHDRRVTVAETSQGLEARAVELAGQPPTEQLQLLQRKLQREERRLAQLNGLRKQLLDLRRQNELLDEADAEVDAAERRAESAGARDDSFREASRRLANLEERANTLARNLSDVHAAMGLEGGLSPEDAMADLRAALESLDLVGADALDVAERDVRTAIGELSDEANAITNQASSARRSVTLQGSVIETSIANLLTDKRFAWMREVDSVEAYLEANDDQFKYFRTLRNAVLNVDKNLQDAVRLPDILTYLAEHALSSEVQGDQVHLIDSLRKVLGDELRRALNSTKIRQYLFDDARVVTVDPVRQHLVLEDGDGKRDVRAFDTFSTGEQAFAFTQARILELEPTSKPNRLLVLDEFGAFIAADRLPDLADFLSSEAVGEIADQVLVILPIQTDYQREVPETHGRLREVYEQRAEQIAQRGYCTVPLEYE